MRMRSRLNLHDRGSVRSHGCVGRLCDGGAARPQRVEAGDGPAHGPGGGPEAGGPVAGTVADAGVDVCAAVKGLRIGVLFFGQ